MRLEFVRFRAAQLDSLRQPATESKGMEKNLYPNCDMSIWLRSCVKEVEEPVEGMVENEIPHWLEGCLIRNGPGCLKVGDSEFQHLFDGLALLHRFYIKKGKVTYQNRFLKSETYRKNSTANRIVVTEFGTKSIPDPCQTIFQKVSAIFDRFNNQSDNAMISIYPFGDEYFAMTESPVIHRINPDNLTTEERVNISEHIGIVSHTSHPHITQDKTVYNLGMIVSKTGPKYCIIEFPQNKVNDESTFKSSRIITTIPSRWKFNPSYMHTFGITENYFVIVEQPLSVSMCGVFLNALANRPLSRALKWFKKETTVFYVIKRSTGEISHRFHTNALFYLHIINQYEDQNHLVMDICCYRNPAMIDCMYVKSLKEGQHNPDYAEMFRGRPLRFVMPLGPHKKTQGNLNSLPHSKSRAFFKGSQIFIEPELLCDLGCETPRVYYEEFSGRKYKFFYAISSDVDLENPGTLIKVDVETKTRKTWCEPNVFPSEPIFVPKPNSQSEDDGVILSALIWGREKVNQVGLLVLDAKTWTEIGRAVFTTNTPVPKCLHGWFIKDTESKI